jgi:hypothetical protein
MRLAMTVDDRIDFKIEANRWRAGHEARKRVFFERITPNQRIAIRKFIGAWS